ncbi:MAG TPA: hypothetical protein VND93_00005 [Myxococcales bacterium]|nr:hypothetical protein [Myxococcales bacterium]
MSAMKSLAVAVLTVALAACGSPPEGPPLSPPPSPEPAPSPLPSPTPVPAIAVRGRAVGLNGLPVIGLTAVIAGHPAVNVDGDGQFAIADVRAPYDLTLVDGAAQHATIYRGLTRVDPTIVVSDARPASSLSATISGTVTGGHYPQQSGEDSWAAFVSPQVRALTRINGSGSAGAFSLPVGWAGAATVAGRVHALQFSWQGSLPASFTGYGSAGVTLSGGGTFAPAISMAPITSGTITGMVALPSAYSVIGKQYAIHLDGIRAMAINDATASDSFTYVVPNVTGAELSAVVVAGDPLGNAIIHTSAPVPAGGAIRLAPRPAPELILPANGARDVGQSMTFSWSTFEGGIHRVAFAEDGGSGYRVTVFTRDGSTTLPDLSALGLSIPRGAPFRWSVTGIAPVSGTDEIASPAFADRLALSSGKETFYGLTVERTLTTAP